MKLLSNSHIFFGSYLFPEKINGAKNRTYCKYYNHFVYISSNFPSLYFFTQTANQQPSSSMSFTILFSFNYLWLLKFLLYLVKLTTESIKALYNRDGGGVAISINLNPPGVHDMELYLLNLCGPCAENQRQR